ncbi:MAG: DNA double-strand break repair nuclease NurA [Promethearchaeati archaeon SRVP18_Atabeyarchaeia-1]
MVGEIGDLNRLVLHPSFNETIDEINKLGICIPSHPIAEEMDFNSYLFPPQNGKLVTNIEEPRSFDLDAGGGQDLLKEGIPICAYDESMSKFSSLEGTAFVVSHSLVIHRKDDYVPSCYLTLNFYTRSKTFTENSKLLKYSDNPEQSSKLDYVRDRTELLLRSAPSNSIVFIDGVLIGGQLSSYTIRMNEELLRRNIIPIFFVKNSASNLVTDHIDGLVGRYNSDMHWAYTSLKPGQRTSFFQYQDARNTANAKLFCYLKAFEISPQRVEFHVSTFKKYGKKMSALMDLAYYLMLVQGDLSNPQIRPIAVAEKYARETLRLVDLDKLMRRLGITSTVNQERFGWS